MIVHEQDKSNGGCELSEIVGRLPRELLSTSLFDDDIVIPLYSTPEYRQVSLKEILLRMGANVKVFGTKKWLS